MTISNDLLQGLVIPLIVKLVEILSPLDYPQKEEPQEKPQPVAEIKSQEEIRGVDSLPPIEHNPITVSEIPASK